MMDLSPTIRTLSLTLIPDSSLLQSLPCLPGWTGARGPSRVGGPSRVRPSRLSLSLLGSSRRSSQRGKVATSPATTESAGSDVAHYHGGLSGSSRRSSCCLARVRPSRLLLGGVLGRREGPTVAKGRCRHRPPSLSPGLKQTRAIATGHTGNRFVCAHTRAERSRPRVQSRSGPRV